MEKRYGDNHAVNGISLTIGTGEVFGLLGPNGAGKTTTVEILEGYRRADAGSDERGGEMILVADRRAAGDCARSGYVLEIGEALAAERDARWDVIEAG